MKIEDLNNEYGSYKLKDILDKYNTIINATNSNQENEIIIDIQEIKNLKELNYPLIKCVNCDQYFLFDGGCYSIKCIFCKKHFCYLCHLVFDSKYEYLHFPHGPLENCINLKK